ncbi:MAG: hypothetical protein H0W50_01275 [Parachlamydiaceae bacterium]|nr:hypothetical protein [Parachlamydiaceae bacterium]
MDIFTTSIRSLLKGPNDALALDSKSGRFKVLGSFEKKFVSRLSPMLREKLFGINNEKLPELIASHKVSSKVEQAILDDNISCLIELGVLSSVTPREKLHDIVIQAMDTHESAPGTLK